MDRGLDVKLVMEMANALHRGAYEGFIYMNAIASWLCYGAKAEERVTFDGEVFLENCVFSATTLGLLFLK
jgi:hypothetical protein